MGLLKISEIPFIIFKAFKISGFFIQFSYCFNQTLLYNIDYNIAFFNYI